MTKEMLSTNDEGASLQSHSPIVPSSLFRSFIIRNLSFTIGHSLLGISSFVIHLVVKQKLT